MRLELHRPLVAAELEEENAPDGNIEDVMNLMIMLISKHKGAEFTDDLTGQPLDPRRRDASMDLAHTVFTSLDIGHKLNCLGICFLRSFL